VRKKKGDPWPKKEGSLQEEQPSGGRLFESLKGKKTEVIRQGEEHPEIRAKGAPVVGPC